MTVISTNDYTTLPQKFNSKYTYIILFVQLYIILLVNTAHRTFTIKCT